MAVLTTKGSHLWDYLKVSIWFIPFVMCLGAFVLAFAMLEFDTRYGFVPWRWATVLRIDAAGARQVVAVITGAMITVTGVVFSVTVVALTLASNQFGPKVLRNYLRDTGNKVVLGLFVATFVYGLLILASVDAEHGGFVPVWSMVVSIVLALFAVGGLIYFLNNIALSIQADQIIALIGEDLNESIGRLLVAIDRGHDQGRPRPCEQDWSARIQGLTATEIDSPASGYLQALDYDALAALAAEHDCYLEIHRRAGHFVIEGAPVGVCHAAGEMREAVIAEVLAQVQFGRQRTPVQDIEFSIEQLVQIALHALSPGINDSPTCITCINWLGAALGRMARCEFQPFCFADQEGTPRVVAKSFSFAGAVNAAIDPIRQNARDSVMVTIRMLEVLNQVIGVCGKPGYCKALYEQAGLIHAAALESVPREADRDAVEKRFEQCGSTYIERTRVLTGA